MRAVFLALILGAISMTVAVSDAGQEKKDEPKKEPRDPYKEYVVVRRWSEAGQKFINPHKDVMAFRQQPKAGLVINLRAADTAGGTPEPKTEITDADGNVYVVTKVEGGVPTYTCRVTKKAQ